LEIELVIWGGGLLRAGFGINPMAYRTVDHLTTTPAECLLGVIAGDPPGTGGEYFSVETPKIFS